MGEVREHRWALLGIGGLSYMTHKAGVLKPLNIKASSRLVLAEYLVRIINVCRALRQQGYIFLISRSVTMVLTSIQSHCKRILFIKSGFGSHC